MTNWKKIEGFPNYSICYEGQVRNDRRGRILKHIQRAGYASVNLSNKGKVSKVNVHRIVAEVFIPNPDNLPLVNHKDEDRMNPHGDNLEWCTYKENMQYSNPILHKLKRNGKVYYVHDVRGFCKEHGISTGTISNLLNHKKESISGWSLS